MGVLLTFIVLLAACIVWLRSEPYEELWPIFGLGLSVFLLAILGLTLVLTASTDVDLVVAYENDTKKFEVAVANTNLTSEERTSILDLVTQDNTTISKARVWRDNFWVGWFTYNKTSQLELFDIKKIPQAKMSVQLGNK